MVVALFLFWRKAVRDNNEALLKQGNEIIKKLEDYKEKYHRAPDSLQEIGIKLPGEYPLYYIKEDSLNYSIGFPISSFHSKAYHSARKEWGID